MPLQSSCCLPHSRAGPARLLGSALKLLRLSHLWCKCCILPSRTPKPYCGNLIARDPDRRPQRERSPLFPSRSSGRPRAYPDTTTGTPDSSGSLSATRRSAGWPISATARHTVTLVPHPQSQFRVVSQPPRPPLNRWPHILGQFSLCASLILSPQQVSF